MKTVLLLRGHIRNAFDDQRLLHFVRSLDVDVYIHTWAETEAKSSWRPLDRSKVRMVTEAMIRSYFVGVKLRSIVIENDEHGYLLGSQSGNVGGIPKVAWKRMWLGMFQGMSEVRAAGADLVINMRMDNFQCWQSLKSGLDESAIVAKLDAVSRGDDCPLIHGLNRHYGCDNVMIGAVDMLWRLVCKFHFDLDWILERNYSFTDNQEYLVICLLEDPEMKSYFTA